MSAVYQVYPKKKKVFNLSLNLKLIILNVILTMIFTILLFLDNSLVDFIAINPANILHGAYLWTFFTSMFMHGGLFHLFANMISLFFIGGLVEKILGSKRYLLFYFGSGLVASIFFVLSGFIDVGSMNSYAVGASGAIFGLVGLLVLLTPNLPVYIMFIPIPVKMKYAGPGMLFALWLISSAPLVFGGQSLPIGNWAHFGGLIAGVVYGIYLKKKFKNKTRMISNHFK
jgi:membrane associated rhomboid family serine protease